MCLTNKSVLYFIVMWKNLLHDIPLKLKETSSYYIFMQVFTWAPGMSAKNEL